MGGGIAGLAAAVFLIDDAGMPGKNITIYEKRRDMGGCCGIVGTEGAYICPGERELEPYMDVCGTCAARFLRWTPRAAAFRTKRWT